jgi:hypothetical protein
MHALKATSVWLAFLVVVLAASVPAKRYLTATASVVRRDQVNVRLVRRTGAVVFLGHRIAASQYYQLMAMLYLTRLDYPHYHLLDAAGEAGHDEDDHEHEHEHELPTCNAAGEKYVAFSHGPVGVVPLTARDVQEADARAHYIDAHIDEFIDVTYFYNLLGLANALDPDNESALEFGRGWILNRQMAQCMVRELVDSYARRPGWRAMFNAGWIALYYLRDHEVARRYLQVAAREPGAPPLVAGIYASSFYADRKYAAAVDHLAREIEATADHNLRTRLEQRLAWYRNLLALNRAAQMYRERSGREIGQLDELVTAGLIAAIPADACGGGFVWDAKRHEAASRDANVVLER